MHPEPVFPPVGSLPGQRKTIAFGLHDVNSDIREALEPGVFHG